MDCFSCGGAFSRDERHVSPRYGMWKVSSWLNERHMACAWLSLVWVAFTDFYIYLVSSGALHDLSTWYRNARLQLTAAESAQLGYR